MSGSNRITEKIFDYPMVSKNSVIFLIYGGNFIVEYFFESGGYKVYPYDEILNFSGSGRYSSVEDKKDFLEKIEKIRAPREFSIRGNSISCKIFSKQAASNPIFVYLPINISPFIPQLSPGYIIASNAKDFSDNDKETALQLAMKTDVSMYIELFRTSQIAMTERYTRMIINYFLESEDTRLNTDLFFIGGSSRNMQIKEIDSLIEKAYINDNIDLIVYISTFVDKYYTVMQIIQKTSELDLIFYLERFMSRSFNDKEQRANFMFRSLREIALTYYIQKNEKIYNKIYNLKKYLKVDTQNPRKTPFVNDLFEQRSAFITSKFSYFDPGRELSNHEMVFIPHETSTVPEKEEDNQIHYNAKTGEVLYRKKPLRNMISTKEFLKAYYEAIHKNPFMINDEESLRNYLTSAVNNLYFFLSSGELMRFEFCDNFTFEQAQMLAEKYMPSNPYIKSIADFKKKIRELTAKKITEYFSLTNSFLTIRNKEKKHFGEMIDKLKLFKKIKDFVDENTKLQVLIEFMNPNFDYWNILGSEYKYEFLEMIKHPAIVNRIDEVIRRMVLLSNGEINLTTLNALIMKRKKGFINLITETNNIISEMDDSMNRVNMSHLETVIAEDKFLLGITTSENLLSEISSMEASYRNIQNEENKLQRELDAERKLNGESEKITSGKAILKRMGIDRKILDDSIKQKKTELRENEQKNSNPLIVKIKAFNDNFNPEIDFNQEKYQSFLDYNEKFDDKFYTYFGLQAVLNIIGDSLPGSENWRSIIEDALDRNLTLSRNYDAIKNTITDEVTKIGFKGIDRINAFDSYIENSYLKFTRPIAKTDEDKNYEMMMKKIKNQFEQKIWNTYNKIIQQKKFTSDFPELSEKEETDFGENYLNTIYDESLMENKPVKGKAKQMPFMDKFKKILGNRFDEVEQKISPFVMNSSRLIVQGTPDPDVEEVENNLENFYLNYTSEYTFENFQIDNYLYLNLPVFLPKGRRLDNNYILEIIKAIPVKPETNSWLFEFLESGNISFTNEEAEYSRDGNIFYIQVDEEVKIFNPYQDPVPIFPVYDKKSKKETIHEIEFNQMFMGNIIPIPMKQIEKPRETEPQPKKQKQEKQKAEKKKFIKPESESDDEPFEFEINVEEPVEVVPKKAKKLPDRLTKNQKETAPVKAKNSESLNEFYSDIKAAFKIGNRNKIQFEKEENPDLPDESDLIMSGFYGMMDFKEILKFLFNNRIIDYFDSKDSRRVNLFAQVLYFTASGDRVVIDLFQKLFSIYLKLMYFAELKKSQYFATESIKNIIDEKTRLYVSIYDRLILEYQKTQKTITVNLDDSDDDKPVRKNQKPGNRKQRGVEKSNNDSDDE